MKSWPEFAYSVEKLHEISVTLAQELGLVKGLILGLNEELKQETILEILISEAIKTSEIEGEFLSREDVMSSIKNNLGLHQHVPVKDKRVSGIANLMIEVSQATHQNLTTELLCSWHHTLLGHNIHIHAGVWRSGKAPMQVISGAYGREIIHFEAPPSDRVPDEMDRFISWFQQPDLPANDPIASAVLKAAIAHLYFETIHPFEDGNGRIGRALAEFSLSNSLNSPVILSLSKTIEKDKKAYYDQLKYAQAHVDCTPWINYFAQVILDAQKDASEMFRFTVLKTKFLDTYKEVLNPRQAKVVNRMLENGSMDFESGMTTKKYMSITSTSKATATRDLQNLHEIGLFRQEGAGRSIRYHLVFE